MSERPAARPPWYRSLYWRIALGLVTVLAVMLASQGLLFVYFTYPQADSLQSRTPAQLSVMAAAELSTALTQDPGLDLEAFVHDRYDRVFQPVVVTMKDGRTAVNHSRLVPPAMLAMLRRQAARGVLPQAFPPGAGPRGPSRRLQRRGPDGEREPPPDLSAPDLEPGAPVAGDENRPRPRPPGGMGPIGMRRLGEFQPVLVNGDMVGIVAALPIRAPFSLILQQVGPTMALAGLTVLVLGGAVMALVVFGPARRRLRHLQDATERIGRGDYSVRAPAGGGDEVAELATSFNRMADELASRAAALDAADQTRRQLLADVSHELMTPLTAMRGYIETLTMPELPLDAPTRERYLGIVDDQTRRMEHIVGDLLDLARLEGGSPIDRVRDVQIAQVFDRVATRHERELTARRVTLERDVAGDAGVLRADPDRLEQVLQNLTGNALRFTPDGGRITLRATAQGASIVLTVRDNGPGIPASHLPRVFDRFYKVDAARRATGGSGLGLSIVKAIVERHGGRITARNDGGAVFEIMLPRSGGL